MNHEISIEQQKKKNKQTKIAGPETITANLIGQNLFKILGVLVLS